MSDHSEIRAAIESLGLTIESVFVPFSQSRNKAEKMPSLNWRVTLKRDGREVLTTDYMAGPAHCPAYKRKQRATERPNDRREEIAHECETGKTARRAQAHGAILSGKPILPDPLDVLYSLTMDSDVLDYGTFEEWAGSFGYEADSRKAESIYRACLEIALKLRNGVGDAGMARLREIFEDY